MMLRARMLMVLAQPASQEVSPWLWLAAAAIALLLILALLSPRLRRRNNALAQITPAQQRAVERDMQNLVHELNEMARRIGAQLDSRSARLEELIHQADDRLRQLRDAAPSHNGDAATTESTRDPVNPDEPDPRHAEIYALCEQGLTAVQIAERLHRPSGEVELILALRPRGRAAV
jgi:hypothetical protein